MATLKDIAKLANVNVSTVSKALRNTSDLNENTVAMIRRYADQLGYPYTVKASPAKRRPVIGIVCPEIISSYYTGVLDSFQTYMRKAGYHTLITVSGFSDMQELDCVSLLMNYDICGLVCFTEKTANYPALQKMSEQNSNVTFLVVTMTDECYFCDCISIDDFQGTAMAVNHLAELGHQRIAYVGDILSGIRRDAFLTAMEANHLPVPAAYVVESELRFEECGYMGMKQLLALSERPTGIFASYDNVAIGAMRAIYEEGLQIPEDFSIIGVDNIKTAAYMYRGLTSVTEPTADLGEVASTLLLEKIEGQKSTLQNIKLRPILNIRETTAPPAPHAFQTTDGLDIAMTEKG